LEEEIMVVKQTLGQKAQGAVIGQLLDQAIGYVHKNPEKNFDKLVNTLEKLDKMFPSANNAFSTFLTWVNGNPGSKAWFIELLSRDVNQVKTFMKNMFVNVSLKWMQTNEQLQEQHGIVAPYTILISPTMRCNLRCRGCYAGEYTTKDDLSIDEVRDIIKQAKELGTHFFTILGGEPFIRFWELAEIFEENSDCLFQVFTSGVLITDEVADKLKELKNVVIAVSVNGDKEETDYMRGPGIYDKVLAAMARMKERNLLFGMSLVLTKHNYDLMTSREFYLSWREKGVVYAWNFLYMPVGSDPIEAAKLMPTPEQRYEYGEFIQKFRNEEPIYIMDFWADAPFVHGCIAGGRRYLHINHKGDVEPCIFAHYATDNIREKSLLECLQSPFFTEIRAHQPHTDNLLRPCMIIDNPQVLRNAVKRNGAKPTHEGAGVIINELAPILDEYAENAAKALDPKWEKDWQKRIKDMETRAASYGEGMDRIQKRVGQEQHDEKMEKLRKNDPEYAKLFEEKAVLAQEDYNESVLHKKFVESKEKVTE
jgi:MoaA/NifB/PqqE/SkfB family radical SAM enzyme